MGNREAKNTRCFVGSMMCLYEGAKTRVIVGLHLSEGFEV